MSEPELPNESNFREWFANTKHPPASAPLTWYQARGFQFERALHWLLNAEGLSPRTSYRRKGEQIDGAFVSNHRYFLLEAKWHRKPIGNNDLDAFDAKVERRLSGTLGVFISMSGYSRDVADTLVKSKRLKVIMFGAADMEASFDIAVGFSQVLLAKLRAAAEYGMPYHEYRPFVVTTAGVAQKSTRSAKPK